MKLNNYRKKLKPVFMLRFIKILLIVIGMYVPVYAHEVVELKIPGSNKVVIKFMFRNGSVTDPAGKEGLTKLTTSLITEGGTKNLTQQQITDIIYPWAANYYSSTDKEVSIFTFEVPLVFLEKFYPVIRDLMLTPSFTPSDFDRVKSNQQNYVDEVIRSSSDEEYSKKALEEKAKTTTQPQQKKDAPPARSPQSNEVR